MKSGAIFFLNVFVIKNCGNSLKHYIYFIIETLLKTKKTKNIPYRFFTKLYAYPI